MVMRTQPPGTGVGHDQPFPQQTRGGRFRAGRAAQEDEVGGALGALHAHGVQHGLDPAALGDGQSDGALQVLGVVPGGQGGSLADGGHVERRTDTIEIARQLGRRADAVTHAHACQAVGL